MTSLSGNKRKANEFYQDDRKNQPHSFLSPEKHHYMEDKENDAEMIERHLQTMNDRLNDAMEELDEEVDRKCEEFQRLADSMVLAIRNELSVQLTLLPQRVRTMSVYDFRKTFGEDVSAVHRSDMHTRLRDVDAFISRLKTPRSAALTHRGIVTPRPPPSPGPNRKKHRTHTPRNTTTSARGPKKDGATFTTGSGGSKSARLRQRLAEKTNHVGHHHHHYHHHHNQRKKQSTSAR
eukprot:gb/GECH01003410.1/.p1 GENE.gb/GECH01003410.1/~~gb/GECH01003410.1/.p1  ORF type:complete len:235 (+),score=51.98 gb/GECH01003410.1/:1-705(+)